MKIKTFRQKWGGYLCIALLLTSSSLFAKQKTTSESPVDSTLQLSHNVTQDIELLNDYFDAYYVTEDEQQTIQQELGLKAEDEITDYSEILDEYKGEEYKPDIIDKINGYAKKYAVQAAQKNLPKVVNAGLSYYLGPTVGNVAGNAVSKQLIKVLGFGSSSKSEQTVMTKLNEMADDIKMIQDHLDDLTEKVSNLKLDRAFETKRQKYLDVYYQATITWNTIDDARWICALHYKYGDNITSSPDYLKSSSEEKTAFMASLADDEKFAEFLASDNIYVLEQDKAVTKAIHAWGNKGYAVDYLTLADFLTKKEIGQLGKERYNMFQVYDQLAFQAFVWEAEGYTWRNMMRDADCALMLKAGLLANAYFASTEPAGTASKNCELIQRTMQSMVQMAKDYPVEIHSTPICNLDKKKPVIFEKNLHEIKYSNMVETCYNMSHFAKTNKKNVWNWDKQGELWMNHWNSNLEYYSGIRNDQQLMRGMPLSMQYDLGNGGFAISQKWWEALWKAYDIKGYEHPTMLQILKRGGFSTEVIVHDYKFKKEFKGVDGAWKDGNTWYAPHRAIIYPAPENEPMQGEWEHPAYKENVNFTKDTVNYEDLFEDAGNARYIVMSGKKHKDKTFTWKRHSNHMSWYVPALFANDHDTLTKFDDKTDGVEILRFNDIYKHNGRTVWNIYRDYNGDNALRKVEKREGSNDEGYKTLKLEDIIWANPDDLAFANTRSFFVPYLTDKAK